ncbi:MAG TPA: hypothetical protein VNG35_04585, partial [Gemmatimonadales bacterium]|nr:hypothetical protein [Gemmatimonadales bacterium]
MSRGLTGAALASLVFGLFTVLACGNTGLQPGIVVNQVDTLSLYALDGTALDQPSAFRIASPHVLRTDQAADFDFVFNLTAGDSAVLLPTGAVGLGIGSGILTTKANTPFDAITVVPGG